jgi:hypothetical protein
VVLVGAPNYAVADFTAELVKTGARFGCTLSDTCVPFARRRWAHDVGDCSDYPVTTTTLPPTLPPGMEDVDDIGDARTPAGLFAAVLLLVGN